MSHKRLEPGSPVRVFKADGGDLVGQYTMPTTPGPLEIRDLAPGRYVARDECGGERTFVVDGREESVSLLVTGASEELPEERVPGEAGAVHVEEASGTGRPNEPSRERRAARERALAAREQQSDE